MPQCPECSSSRSRKSRKQDSKRLPRSWYQAAFRCDDCGHRFLALDALLFLRWFAVSALLVLFLGAILRTTTRDAGIEELRRIVQSQQLAGQAQGSARAPNVQVAGETGTYVGVDELAEAAEGGDTESRYQLATILFEKSAFSGDLATREEALAWLRQAASDGHPQAQAELGDRYLAGRNVVQDFSQAALWYQLAAEQGEPGAMYNLGKMARFGWGISENIVDAYVWLNVASARGDTRAEEDRAQVLTQLSGDELRDAQQRARELDETIPRLAALRAQ